MWLSPLQTENWVELSRPQRRDALPFTVCTDQKQAFHRMAVQVPVYTKLFFAKFFKHTPEKPGGIWPTPNTSRTCSRARNPRSKAVPHASRLGKAATDSFNGAAIDFMPVRIQPRDGFWSSYWRRAWYRTHHGASHRSKIGVNSNYAQDRVRERTSVVCTVQTTDRQFAWMSCRCRKQKRAERQNPPSAADPSKFARVRNSMRDTSLATASNVSVSRLLEIETRRARPLFLVSPPLNFVDHHKLAGRLLRPLEDCTVFMCFRLSFETATPKKGRARTVTVLLMSVTTWDSTMALSSKRCTTLSATPVDGWQWHAICARLPRLPLPSLLRPLCLSPSPPSLVPLPLPPSLPPRCEGEKKRKREPATATTARSAWQLSCCAGLLCAVFAGSWYQVKLDEGLRVSPAEVP